MKNYLMVFLMFSFDKVYIGYDAVEGCPIHYDSKRYMSPDEMCGYKINPHQAGCLGLE
jgi:hypothetical protein